MDGRQDELLRFQALIHLISWFHSSLITVEIHFSSMYEIIYIFIHPASYKSP
jgi:hypothetical protein